MTSIRGRIRPPRRSQASEAPTGPLLSNGDHKDPLGSNIPGLSEAPTGSKASAGPETLAGPEAPPKPPQVPLFPFPKILALIAIANRTWIKSSRRFSMLQKENLEINLRPRPQTLTAVGHIWNTTTFARNVKTILPPAGPPGQTEFHLRPLFYETKSTFTGSSISGS